MNHHRPDVPVQHHHWPASRLRSKLSNNTQTQVIYPPQVQSPPHWGINRQWPEQMIHQSIPLAPVTTFEVMMEFFQYMYFNIKRCFL